MKLWHNVLMGVLAMPLTGCTLVEVAAFEARTAAKEKTPFQEQEMAIYAHMKRYGINRDDAAAIRRLHETNPPHSYPHVSITTNDLLKPGEHYRIEMDEFILTIKVPDADDSRQWIWPYNNTRAPDPGMEKFLKQSNGALQVANLGWYACGSIFPPGLFGRCEVMGVSMRYRILKPEEREKFSTPEKLRQLSIRIQKNLLPSREKIEESVRGISIINHAATRVVLEPETVVINGRVWVRDAMNRDSGRSYVYTTTLSPDRMLGISFGLPKYDYNANPDASIWPAPIKRAFAQIEEMVASLRVAKVNDGGAPDPFVIERVEPAPLPVREKLPSSQ